MPIEIRKKLFLSRAYLPISSWVQNLKIRQFIISCLLIVSTLQIKYTLKKQSAYFDVTLQNEYYSRVVKWTL